MKIEKLTENKIRIILNIDDLMENNIDLQSFMSNPSKAQSFLGDILNQAEQEVGFVTKDCKIMIEALASSDGNFVFTITKFTPSNDSDTVKKKKLKFKKKSIDISSTRSIYSFSSFEEFCNLCENLSNSLLSNLNDFSRDISLYLYNNTYYLIINNINTNFPNIQGFYAVLSEFAKLVNHSSNFEAKLKEHGKVIIKKNAIKKGISYFA